MKKYVTLATINEREHRKGLNIGQDDMEIGIPSNEYCKHDPERGGHDPEICH